MKRTSIRNYRLLVAAFLLTVPVVCIKYTAHLFGLELIQLGSLHSSIVSGTFFVLGFLLSATIADYKESEKIPAEVAAILENMHEDALSMKLNYPKVDLEKFTNDLHTIAVSFGDDVRNRTSGAQLKIHNLSDNLASLEAAGVPANFIVKLKQQQARLTHILLRVSYIQRIMFIPSAIVLARAIVVLTLGLLVLTEIEPFYGGLATVGIISLMLVYVLELIGVISVPFRKEGATQDDVSLFLIDQSADHIAAKRQ